MSETEPGSRVGQRFGPYQLKRLLGRGGMGEVYEAEDTVKDRVVALKLMSAEVSSDPVFRERMQREAHTAGRLQEPHAVPIHDYGEIGGQLYIDMRMIKGTDLDTVLARYGPMPPARAVGIVGQVASALDAAHAAGVTHRDVKPANILITEKDFAYLVDFGIAAAASDVRLTQAGTAMGTWRYMAPERFGNAEVTYRADIYSLACVLHECLTGSPPYRGETIEKLVGAHLTQPIPRPSQLRPGIPEALDAVIARGMAKDPQDRFRTAGDLAAAAHQALSAPDQDHAAAILQQAETASLPTSAGFTTPGAGADTRTQAAWTPSQGAPTGSWRNQPGIPSPVSPVRPPDFTRAPGPDDKRKRWILIGAAALVVIAVVVAVVLLVAGPTQSDWTSAKGQTVLPFSGLNYRLSPSGVALDTAGNVYITSESMRGKVLKLAAGSSSPTELPFNGLYQPQGLAVDGSGAVYVTDFNNRVVKLAAGSNDQTVLPFNGLNYPEGVAVGSDGSVYVADRGNNRVVKLAAGSNAQTDLPFNGLTDPDGVAVGTDGSVYVTDTNNNRVLRLAAGSNDQTVLPFTGVTVPWGIAVDSAGAVYVTEHDNSRVVKLPAGATAPTKLPFKGLNTPLAVTVDKNGNVYIADRGNNDVVRLAAG